MKLNTLRGRFVFAVRIVLVSVALFIFFEHILPTALSDCDTFWCDLCDLIVMITFIVAFFITIFAVIPAVWELTFEKGGWWDQLLEWIDKQDSGGEE